MRNPKKFYFLLLSLITVVLLATAAGFVLAHQRLNSEVIKIKKLSGDITLANEQIDRLQNLDTDYQKLSPLAKKVQSVLPAQKQQSEVIALISTIAARQGLGLSGLSFDPTQGLPDEKSQTMPAKISGILVMPVRFEAGGSYEQLQGLLRALEQQQRYMRVSTLDITRSSENKTLSFSITIEVFLRP